MAEQKSTEEKEREPRGLGEHTRGLAGEYAHEQGWGLNEAERTAVPQERQPTYGGTEYDYGARDFGDEATDFSAPQDTSAETMEQEVKQALGLAEEGSGAETSGAGTGRAETRRAEAGGAKTGGKRDA